jgi:hypothetical protein
MAHSSRLFYHGTKIEVQLGDKVRVKRFLLRPKEGYVCYLPEISPRNAGLEYADVKQWAICFEGYLNPILYDPDSFQPPKGISFVERTNTAGLSPDEVLE